MAAFIVNLCIVLVGVGLCIDWPKLFNDLFKGFIVALGWLGEMTENLFYRAVGLLGNGTEKVLFVLIVLPANYFNGYSYKGKHRRDNARQPTDSEVDRWRGADDKFADFLHTLNSEIHLNDQARA